MLKQSGYAVFPALKLEEARSRCMRGGYDLIIVNAGEQLQDAMQFCDNLRASCPEQPLLMCTGGDAEAAQREYAAPVAADGLLQRVDALLKRSSSGDYANAA